MLCDSNDIYRQRGAKLLKWEFLFYYMFLWITSSEFPSIAFISLFTKIQKQGRSKARPGVLTAVLLTIQVFRDFTLVLTPWPSSSGRMVCLALKKTLRSFETSVPIYQMTPRQIAKTSIFKAVTLKHRLIWHYTKHPRHIRCLFMTDYAANIMLQKYSW